MALKFAANLNFLFTEGAVSLAERIRLAHSAGFKAVEIPFPRGCEEDVIKAKKETGIQIALMNIALGPDDFTFGSASIPGAEQSFKEHFSETLAVAKLLDCKKIHIMSGLCKQLKTENYLQTYENNLKYAATNLEKEGIVGVIEPINKYALPLYFMNSYQIAGDVLKNINSKNLKLMVDIFHLQHIQGNISNTFKDLKDIIGNIQIAQVPHRNEPHIPGELDFSYIFELIKNIGYDDWIGLEYKPKTTTLEGLVWLDKYGFHL